MVPDARRTLAGSRLHRDLPRAPAITKMTSAPTTRIRCRTGIFMARLLLGFLNIELSTEEDRPAGAERLQLISHSLHFLGAIPRRVPDVV
jgi:hypothetical protein